MHSSPPSGVCISPNAIISLPSPSSLLLCMLHPFCSWQPFLRYYFLLFALYILFSSAPPSTCILLFFPRVPTNRSHVLWYFMFLFIFAIVFFRTLSYHPRIPSIKTVSPFSNAVLSTLISRNILTTRKFSVIAPFMVLYAGALRGPLFLCRQNFLMAPMFTTELCNLLCHLIYFNSSWIDPNSYRLLQPYLCAPLAHSI